MMKVILALLFCIVVVAAFEDPGEFFQGGPEQSTNPPNWIGTWTALNRYGGVMYTCTKGDRLYGVYSNAGFLIGTIVGRQAEGMYYEGGRGNRNDYQGSFKISISDDNQSFDGLYNRVRNGGFNNTDKRWKETRLGPPYPLIPTAEDCLLPDDTANQFVGSWYRGTEYGALSGNYELCRDEWDQVYGSFYQPEGYISGWSVFDSSAFHGWRYESSGESGAYIMKSLSQNKMKGFYWRGRLAYQNQATSSPESLYRRSFTTTLTKCEAIGPGFTERLKGPNYDPNNPYYYENHDDHKQRNGSASIALSLVVVFSSILFAFL